MGKLHLVPPDLVKKVEAMKTRLQALQEAELTSLQPSLEEAQSMAESLGERPSSGHPPVLCRIFARQ